jgi:2-polyprenyl-6-methoxyphenol hydroxylase-like FAD-dependent oxidoreductase
VIDCRNFNSDGLVVRHSPGCMLGSIKVGADLVYVFVLAHEPSIHLLSRGEHLARLKDLAGRFHGEVLSLIRTQRDPERIIFVPVYEVDTAPYYRGRVALIGDAAHAFPPVLAQGAAMAIEDGVVLSQLLGSSTDIEWALASYESRRRSRVDFVRAQVRQRGILFGLEGPVPSDLKHHPPASPNPAPFYDSLIEEFL